ncbi:MAG TPA: serine hydrolase [Microscillaceae bacterium]|nr:serine hydrolase [Microscillaceae bacterium]
MKPIHYFLWVLTWVSISCQAQTQKNQVLDTTNQPATISTQAPDSTTALVQQIIQKHAKVFLKDSITNSVSVGVLFRGQSITGHYGELDKGKGNTPNDNTIYEIASVTKTFTGTLAAKAVLDGKFGLEDDIRLYLDGKYPNLVYQQKPILIKHLLTHTSGLPADNKGVAEVPVDLPSAERRRRVNAIEKQQTKAKFFKYLHEIAITTVPGTHFKYSNFGTNLMAAIIEKVYKKPFQDLVKEEIIAKAQLKNTRFRLNPKEQQRLANGYNELGILMPHLMLEKTLWGAEGAIKSTIPDLLQYIRFQLDDRNLMAKEAHKSIRELDTHYWIGYFWWIIGAKGKDLHFRHDGGAAGMRNVMLIYPESGIGISVMTNVIGPQIFDNLSKLGKRIYYDLKKQ